MPVINPRMARQAIQTKFIGPSNTRGGRIKAWCQAGSVTLEVDHGLDIEGRHAAVASALMTKLGWDWDFAMGGSPDGNGYVFVEIPEGYSHV